MPRKVVQSLTIMWRSFASIILLCLFVYFFTSQKEELTQLPQVIKDALTRYEILGVFLVGLYVSLQGVTYQAALRTMSKFIPARVATALFLKRFFLGTFLPAGFSLSQYAYGNELKKYDIHEYESHLASTLYLLSGAVAYIAVLLPTLVYLLLSDLLSQNQWYAGLVIIMCTIFAAIEFIRFFHKKGFMYWMLNKTFTDIPEVVDVWRKQSYDKTAMRQLFVYSLGVQFLSIAILATSLIAFGIEESLYIALVAYVITSVVMVFSPIFQGIGLVEFAMVYALSLFGVEKGLAVAITLLFRIFQLWFPLLLGALLTLRHRILNK